MKIIFNLLLLIISFNALPSDIFGVIVNDEQTSYFYSDVSTLNKGQRIYYHDEKNTCCNQFTIEENKEGILTEDVISNNKHTSMSDEKTYRFDIKKELENSDNMVFLAWSSPLFVSQKNNKIYINDNLIYSLCLTSEGVLVKLEENGEQLKSFYYYLGYDIEQNCNKKNNSAEDIPQNEMSSKIINKLIEASVKLQEHNTDWVYKNFFIEFITYQGTGDGNYKQLIDTENGNVFYDWVVESIYFVLAHIEFDENNDLIKNCYNVEPERFITSITSGNVVNYNSYCIDNMSLENEQLIINFYLKKDLAIYPEQYKLHIKHKPIDNSFRLYRLSIEQ